MTIFHAIGSLQNYIRQRTAVRTMPVLVMRFASFDERNMMVRRLAQDGVELTADNEFEIYGLKIKAVF